MRVLIALILSLAASACRTPPSAPPPENLDKPAPADTAKITPAPAPIAPPVAPAHAVAPPSPLENDAIVICGHRVHIGTRVVLWTEPPYYDASREDSWSRDASDQIDSKTGLRYRPGRVRTVPNPAAVARAPGDKPDQRTASQKEPSMTEVVVPAGSHDEKLLTDVVDQFVLHFDVCGLSRTCFRVLQDDRMLSVHFMLDIDGTIYQTLDLRDTAWHATKSNARSIGIEIANMGAYPPNRTGPLEDWYRRDTLGTYIQIPSRIKDSGVLTPGFVGRPARGPERIQGVVQGEDLAQYDFTPEQYASLVKLAAALCNAFPKIAPDAPRDEDGHVIDHALDDEAWRDFHGILGHFHVQTNKTDPGPAFDWDTFLPAVQARLDEIRRSKG